MGASQPGSGGVRGAGCLSGVVTADRLPLTRLGPAQHGGSV